MRCQFLYLSIFFSDPKWLVCSFLAAFFFFLQTKIKIINTNNKYAQTVHVGQYVMGTVKKIGRNAEQRNDCDRGASANAVFELVFEK